MIHNEDGLTLIEVLASIVILSIVGVVIWSVFFQGYRYSQDAISKNLMINESNIIMTTLTNIHQTSDLYELQSYDSNCGIRVIQEKNSLVETIDFNHPRMCFSFVINATGISGNIDPTVTDVPITLTINEKGNANNRVSMESLLYRMKGGD